MLCNQKCPLPLDHMNMQQSRPNQKGLTSTFDIKKLLKQWLLLLHIKSTSRKVTWKRQCCVIWRLPHLRCWQDKTSWKCSCLKLGVSSSSKPPPTKRLLGLSQILWESRKLSASQLALPKHTEDWVTNASAQPFKVRLLGFTDAWGGVCFQQVSKVSKVV